MMTRAMIMRQTHMLHLIDHPAIQQVSDAELAALAALMQFCAEHAVADPGPADLAAFAELCGANSQELNSLKSALAVFGASDDLLAHLVAEIARVHHREEFSAISRAPRPRTRRFSVEPTDLPPDWQDTLRRLGENRAFAPSIIARMTQRLCMFAWSALAANQPVDLTSIPALRAVYVDLRQRSANKNGGLPRFAYLRSSWEEFERFAGACDLSRTAIAPLTKTLNELRRREAAQSAQKFAKVAAAPSASALIAHAEDLLSEAATEDRPDWRQARRNHAAAIALGVAVPARPEDVFYHHRFGTGIVFEPGRGGYTFAYRPQKTRDSITEPLSLQLSSYWSKWIDAVILQDHDPSWLGELRQRAITTQRPLYVNYDGSPCVYAWYSRVWTKTIGTGGHIARTLVYDEMSDLGEFGLNYAKLANHHRSDTIQRKYRSQAAARKSIAAGHAVMIGSGARDDISDLL